MVGDGPSQCTRPEPVRGLAATSVTEADHVNISATTIPDIARPDSHLVVAAQLVAPSPDVQRAAADVLLDAWKLVPWPEGLLSHSVYLGTDGLSVMHYAQWDSVAAHEAFLRDDRPERQEYILHTVAGVERQPMTRYDLYRCVRRDTEAIPGCIVFVEVEFEGPDAGRQREWVDTVIAALEAEPGLPSGGLAAYFHVSHDGMRVVNYAEWVDEAAHIATLDRHGGSLIGAGPLWERAQHFPGMVSNRFRRYRPYRSRTAAGKVVPGGTQREVA